MTNLYLDVKEFAATANITVQAVYQRIKSDKTFTEKYVKKEGRKRYVLKSALYDVYGIQIIDKEDESTSEDRPYHDGDFKTIDILIKQLQEQIKQQQAELDEKNSQINKLHEMLDNQQKLTAMANNKVLLLEEDSKKKKKGIFEVLRNKKYDISNVFVSWVDRRNNSDVE